MLSIVIPARNEGERLEKTLQAYGEFFSEVKDPNEILVVVNDSKDNTLEVVQKYKKKFPSIRYLNLTLGGKGFAILEGFIHSKGDYIGFVDADMSTLPEDFYDLYKNIGDYGGIIASRCLKDSKTKRTFGKYVRSLGFNYLVRGLFLSNFRDTQCGAKIFRRGAILPLIPKVTSIKWAFDVNLLYLLNKSGYKIKEHPTIWEDREGSNIENFLKVPIQMAAGVIRLRLLYSPFKFVVRAYDLLPEKIKVHH